MALRTLYPPLKPYNTGRLRVSSLHELYFEESGNPNGKPVIFVHGGPGGGTDEAQRRFFDPAAYRNYTQPYNITITALDSTHVAGSYSFRMKENGSGSWDLTGTFDAPICNSLNAGVACQQ